jgi:colicin import membrane protein
MTAAAAKAEIGHNSAAIGEMLEESPELLFRDKEMLPALIESIEKEIADQKADASTEKGRKAMKSLAYSIATRKTKYDEAGKGLNEDLRKQINTVDAVRKTMRETLDTLRDKAKAPADAWDKKEDARKLYVTETRAIYADAMRLSLGATYADIADMVSRIEVRAIHPEMLADLLETTLQEQKAALSHLAALEHGLRQAEADRAELARLRAEKEDAERIAREAVAKEAAEKADRERIAAAEKAAAEKAVADERRKAEEAAEAVRIEQAKAIAAAEEVRRQADFKAQIAIDEANRKAKAAEEALEAERRAEAAKVAAAEKARAEQARLDAERQRNQEHRGKLMKAAKEAIMEHGGIKEDAAKQIVLAIVGNSIPHVSMEF